jgi:hypothetical protein
MRSWFTSGSAAEVVTIAAFFFKREGGVMKDTVLRMLGLLLLVLLVFGCSPERPATSETVGDEVAGAPAVGGVPPCSWITEEEATAALEQPSRYRSNSDDGSSNCIIDPVEDGAGISVDFKVTEDVSAWENVSVGMPTISDLGDIAVWTGSAIAVKKGDRYLIANLSNMGSARDLRGPAIEFARVVVEKM